MLTPGRLLVVGILLIGVNAYAWTEPRTDPYHGVFLAAGMVGQVAILAGLVWLAVRLVSSGVRRIRTRRT